MNTNTDKYTLTFAVAMVVLVALLLSFTAVSLKPAQDRNKKLDKMQSILKTIGVKVEREAAEESFKKYITSQISLDYMGKEKKDVKAFDIDLAKENKKSLSKQSIPLFIAEKNSEKYYIIPLRGKGLWDAIWGYISIKEDENEVFGVSFDHAGETPGLGAEITQTYFQERFVKEKIRNSKGEIVGVTVLKGNNDPTGNDKDDNEVDAISGATITGDGVTEMIKSRLSLYETYFANN